MSPLRSVRACSFCGAPMLFGFTEDGKRMPLDPEPNPAGNAAVWRDERGVLRVHILRKGEEPSGIQKRGMPHFATCPKWPKR